MGLEEEGTERVERGGEGGEEGGREGKGGRRGMGYKRRRAEEHAQGWKKDKEKGGREVPYPLPPKDQNTKRPPSG